MFIDFLIEAFGRNPEGDAIVWNGDVYRYAWMLERVSYWQEILRSNEIPKGAVAALEADYSPNAVALFLALVEHGCILVPLTDSVQAKKAEFNGIAQVEVSFSLNDRDEVSISKLPRRAEHEFYARLRAVGHPGLVVFSSGSTGASKAAVHDLVGILEKFKVSRRNLRTITFLLFDHLGGVNTMLYALSNGGCIITIQDRTPDGVLRAVDKYKADLLPTSPTFINLILFSEAYKRHDLSSLRMVTYGTEPMQQSVLERFHALFPRLMLLQTYGLSEVGVLRSKSKNSDSLWVKIGGEGFETRVVDGLLEIKARSAMMGYLNAPSPFTEDGWLITQDRVEVDGEYLKILGRESEIINVGGEKVYPMEVESVIHEMSNIAEATVFSEKNPIVGNLVCVRVTLLSEEDPKEFTLRLKQHCGLRLQKYKVPVKVLIVEGSQHSSRFKKIRVQTSAAPGRAPQ